MAMSNDTHTCPFCDLVFSYHEEVKDHVVHDHPAHAASFYAVEIHELPPSE